MKKVIYLWLVRLVAGMVKNRAPQEIAYVMSFGNNQEFIRALAQRARQLGVPITILYKPNCVATAQQLAADGIKVQAFTEGLCFLGRPLRVIMNARLLFCDNYYAFLAGCPFDHQQTTVVQVWHANGAVKSFGWEEPQTRQRSRADKRRFQRVYDQFDEYVVGSTQMARVFARSYHVPESRGRVLGYPRSDRLFDQTWRTQIPNRIYKQYPELQGKEVFLYAPTYREDAVGKPVFNIPDDFAQIVAGLSSKQRLIIKLHPHVQATEQAFIKRFGRQVMVIPDFTTEDLLTVTDCLITDYSSVIFDYAVLPNAGRMIFYWYDEAEYQQRVGLQPDMAAWLPGPICRNAREVSAALQSKNGQANLVSFNAQWNTMNDGEATRRVLDTYLPVNK
ncbi:CDP-glycerol glycerophosphotransferase family protein [Ligilactobacillus sp. LYQ60]|uniref:CDP-glycerol glycerophosphotransferase family protein n=1 Tax=unclassified Ligilactobacillus TaxID=2767920 RepID=UPI003854BB79